MEIEATRDTTRDITRDMTREESIEFSGKLEKGYAMLEKLLKAADEIDVQLRLSPSFPPKARNSGVFYQGYLLVGLMLCFFVMPVVNLFIIGPVISFFGIIEWTPHDIGSAFECITTMLICSIVLTIIEFIGIQVFGYHRSKKRMIQYNADIDQQINDWDDRVRTLQNQKKELVTRTTEVLKELYLLDKNIPLQFRTSRHMHRIKIILISAKAKSFEQAIALLAESEPSFVEHRTAPLRKATNGAAT